VDWVVQGALEAPASERAKKVREARWLISMEKEPRDRSWFLGVLFEGLGEVDAIGHYAEAARLGRQDAEPRLVAMLKHHSCAFRSRAAETLADLRLVRQTEALWALWREGGADDEAPLFGRGCDSKAAATLALERLRQ
jgi:ClpP class serine protease